MPTRKKTTNDLSNTEIKIDRIDTSSNQIKALEALRININSEINNIINILVAQLNQFDETKKKIEVEFNEKLINQKKSEEMQNFNQMMELKKKLAEFEEKIQLKTKEFEEYKESEIIKLKLANEELDRKQEEYQNLKTQVNSFPSQLEKAVETAKKEISTELKKDFESDKKITTQKAEFEMKLLQQQVVALQQSLRQQEKEVESLKEEKERLMKQISELAVAVIKGKESLANNHSVNT